MRKKKAVFISALLGFLFHAKTAYAYIDPATGSYILQVLFAVLLGALFFIKSIWMKVKFFFQNLFSSKPDEER